MAKEQKLIGMHSVMEALQSGKELEKVLFRKGLAGEQARKLQSDLRKAGIPVQYVPDERLNRITGKNHQGVIAFVSPIEYTRLDMLVPLLFESGEIPALLFLDGVTDVRNFGSICRSAECAGIHAVIIPAKGSARINEDAIQTSAGALNYIPVCRVEHPVEALKYLKESGFKLFSTSEKAGDNYFNISFADPLVFVLGAEDKGISGNVLEECDTAIKIPLQGQIGSLNVSNAASILMFEMVRQRSSD